VPAYLVVDMDVKDMDQYREYMPAAAAAIAQYGGKYLARGGNPQSLEGDWQPTRIVIIEFEDVDHAQRFYHSGEYQAAIALRKHAAQARIVLVEGYEM
jgi:uncharacterized protein (DUF1330 family)